MFTFIFLRIIVLHIHKVNKVACVCVLSRPPSIGGEIKTAGRSTTERQRREVESRRRRDRDAEGVEGVGNGEGISPSLAD